MHRIITENHSDKNSLQQSPSGLLNGKDWFTNNI